MANRNYEFGVKETITNQLIGQLSLNVKSGMKLDLIYCFAMANITLSTDSAGLLPVPVSAYSLELDGTYTTNEAKAGGTGATVNKAITITNATYAGVDLYISGDNYGSYTDNDIVQGQIDQINQGTNHDDIGTFKYFATYKDRPSLLPFAFDNAASQSTYAALYAEVGDIFEQQHLDAGDSASGAGSFYPTPVPASYPRSGIPDIEITGVTPGTNSFSFVGSNAFDLIRNGVSFRFETLNGDTLPTTSPQIVKGGKYYVRFSVNSFFLYPTESDAIQGSNPITISTTGTGTFRLTQEGIALDDAMDEHAHSVTLSDGGTGQGIATISGSRSNTFTTDATGVRAEDVKNTNVSNENRPSTYYEFGYIKATSPTPVGPLSGTKVLWTGPLSVVSTPTSLNSGEKFSDWDMILFVGNLLSDAAVNRGTSNTLTPSLFNGATSLLFSEEGRFEILRLSDTSFELIVKEQVAANLHTIIGIKL